MIEPFYKQLGLRRCTSIDGRDLVHVRLSENSTSYDGGSRDLDTWWGVRAPEEADLFLHDSLVQALERFTWDQRRAAATADASGFADAFNTEHRLGIRVTPGAFMEEVVADKGMVGLLRSPRFDGRTLEYQVLKTPGLEGPVPPTGRAWRLLAVRVDVAEGTLQHEELARYTEPWPPR
ncbi:hypothetical protein LY474_13205 [Myxococcus stipitatus]|uniref:hypothetical protein n=1 Tax=Myxococcus stipitatus TaxID=83455 RepID=UPI001F1B7A44|nr:hypothetical protein [Myxococcus stipitatus]MCE9668776.1 hypothetical protein [Myxococcus stipitatus]